MDCNAVSVQSHDELSAISRINPKILAALAALLSRLGAAVGSGALSTSNGMTVLVLVTVTLTVL